MFPKRYFYFAIFSKAIAKFQRICYNNAMSFMRAETPKKLESLIFELYFAALS